MVALLELHRLRDVSEFVPISITHTHHNSTLRNRKMPRKSKGGVKPNPDVVRRSLLPSPPTPVHRSPQSSTVPRRPSHLQGSKIFKWAVSDDTAAQIVRPPSDLKIVTLAPGTYKASFTEASGVAGPQQYAVKVQFGSRPAAMHVVPDGQTSITFTGMSHLLIQLGTPGQRDQQLQLQPRANFLGLPRSAQLQPNNPPRQQSKRAPINTRGPCVICDVDLALQGSGFAAAPAVSRPVCACRPLDR